MKLAELRDKVLYYGENTLAPQIVNERDLFYFYVMLGGFNIRFEHLIRRFSPAIDALSLVDEEGNVDLDAVEKIGDYAFQHSSLPIAVGKLKHEDFKKLMQYLRN